jgi:hypothetical protein
LFTLGAFIVFLAVLFNSLLQILCLLSKGRSKQRKTKQNKTYVLILFCLLECHRSDIASKSELADEAMEDWNEATESDDAYSGFGGEGSSRDWWGARMTKAAMVPPLTRKYEVIEEYRIVDDFERVAAKMKVVQVSFSFSFSLSVFSYLDTGN